MAPDGPSGGSAARTNVRQDDLPGVSALKFRDDESFPEPLIPLEETDWLAPDDPVLSLTIGGGDPGLPTVPDEGVLDFERIGEGEGSRIQDTATGSTWDAFGLAVEGPLAGTRLKPVIHLDTFWFSWVTFQPETALIDS